MRQNADSFVQLAADGVGKRVRNITLDVLQADGSVQTVNLQVVALVDVDGVPVTLEALLDYEWKRAMLDETRAIRIGVQRLVENRRDFVDCDQDLLAEAQSVREELEDQTVGSQGSGIAGPVN